MTLYLQSIVFYFLCVALVFFMYRDNTNINREFNARCSEKEWQDYTIPTLLIAAFIIGCVPILRIATIVIFVYIANHEE